MSFFGKENTHKFGVKSHVDAVEDDWGGLFAFEAQEKGTTTSSFNSIPDRVNRLPEGISAQEDEEFSTLNLGSKHGSGKCNKSKLAFVFNF